MDNIVAIQQSAVTHFLLLHLTITGICVTNRSSGLTNDAPTGFEVSREKSEKRTEDTYLVFPKPSRITYYVLRTA